MVGESGGLEDSLQRFHIWKVGSLAWSSSSLLSRRVRWKVHSSDTVSAVCACCAEESTVYHFKGCSALPRQLLMSLPATPSFLALLSRYVNSSVVSSFVPFAWICEGFGSFNVIKVLS